MAERLTNTLIVKGTPDEIYRTWTNYDEFPLFMKYIKSIEKIDEKTSRWTVQGPLGKDITWVAEITRDDVDKRIAWKTIEGDIDINGQVTFLGLPDEQTEVAATLMYVLPGGFLGNLAASVLSNPQRLLAEGMRNFKDMVEGHYRRLPDKS